MAQLNANASYERNLIYTLQCQFLPLSHFETKILVDKPLKGGIAIELLYLKLVGEGLFMQASTVLLLSTIILMANFAKADGLTFQFKPEKNILLSRANSSSAENDVLIAERNRVRDLLYSDKIQDNPDLLGSLPATLSGEIGLIPGTQHSIRSEPNTCLLARKTDQFATEIGSGKNSSVWNITPLKEEILPKKKIKYAMNLQTKQYTFELRNHDSKVLVLTCLANCTLESDLWYRSETSCMKKGLPDAIKIIFQELGIPTSGLLTEDNRKMIGDEPILLNAAGVGAQ